MHFARILEVPIRMMHLAYIILQRCDISKVQRELYKLAVFWLVKEKTFWLCWIANERTAKAQNNQATMGFGDFVYEISEIINTANDFSPKWGRILDQVFWGISLTLEKFRENRDYRCK